MESSSQALVSSISIDGISIPGPVIMAILMIWRGQNPPTGQTEEWLEALDCSSFTQDRLKEAGFHLTSPVVCGTCIRVLGYCEMPYGGFLKSHCSQCGKPTPTSHAAYWHKITQSSQILKHWGTDIVICKVLDAYINR